MLAFLHSRTAWCHACIHVLHDVILAFTYCMLLLLHSHNAWCHSCIHVLHDIMLAFTYFMMSSLHSRCAWFHYCIHILHDVILVYRNPISCQMMIFRGSPNLIPTSAAKRYTKKKKNILIMERHRLRQTLTQSCAKEMMPRGQRASLPFYTNSGSKTRRHTRDQSRLTSGLNKNNQIIWDRYSACFSSGALEKLSKNRMYWQRKGENRLKHS